VCLLPERARVFFFQAEDGIRDFHVTGVQTCALPIYAGRGREARPPSPRSRDGPLPFPGGRSWRGFLARQGLENVPDSGLLHAPRSEERRVGKECRSRWPPK